MIFLEPREIISKDVTFQELSRGLTTFDWRVAKDQQPFKDALIGSVTLFYELLYGLDCALRKPIGLRVVRAACGVNKLPLSLKQSEFPRGILWSIIRYQLLRNAIL